MKPFEDKLREEKTPYTLVLSSGERVKVRTHDHLSLPRTEDDEGGRLSDNDRADYFQLWGNGRHSRWIAFNAITSIEVMAPRVQRYAPEMERRLRSRLRPTNDSWRVDENLHPG